ncbi:MAG: hypothetical protein H0W96_11840 [Solirubrobacterales bacterium]|nr:hypothetical protein [Solirubrobacterales bacterium]
MGNRCGGPAIGPADGRHDGALFAEDIRTDPMSIPNGSRAGWTFTAPAGTTITAISYYRRLAASGDPDLVAGLYQGNGIALEECDVAWPVAPGANAACSKPNSQTPVTFTGLNTNALFVGVGCRIERPVAACGGDGTGLNAVQADLYSASVTLAENSLPTLADIGGGLWGGGVVSGVVPVTFAATDPTGIQEQSVRTAGAGSTLVSALQSCDFTVAQPCPQQPAASLSVDTTRVSDGTHTFELVATDAAGNTAAVTSPPVVVDNDGPPPPVGLTVTPAAGSPNAIALTWRNPTGAPALITRAMVQLCHATCPAATNIAAAGAAKVTAPGPGLYGVRLWLIDSHGRGGPHNAALASVRVAPAVVVASSEPAPATRIKAIITGRRLRVTGAIARTGRVRVSWRSKRGLRTLGSGSRFVTIRDHKLAATFVLAVRARAGVTRVVVRSGSSIVAQARARRA